MWATTPCNTDISAPFDVHLLSDNALATNTLDTGYESHETSSPIRETSAPKPVSTRVKSKRF